jgi:hypothetical protein
MRPLLKTEENASQQRPAVPAWISSFTGGYRVRLPIQAHKGNHRERGGKGEGEGREKEGGRKDCISSFRFSFLLLAVVFLMETRLVCYHHYRIQILTSKQKTENAAEKRERKREV